MKGSPLGFKNWKRSQQNVFKVLKVVQVISKELYSSVWKFTRNTGATRGLPNILQLLGDLTMQHRLIE